MPNGSTVNGVASVERPASGWRQTATEQTRWSANSASTLPSITIWMPVS